MVDTVFPSKDPAASASMGGAFATIFRKLMENTDGQLPAVVLSYDRAKNVAKVMPLVTRLDTAGKPLDRETIASVPVLSLGGGGYTLNFPVKAGDRGWIEASDRDISLFMQAGQKKAKPNTLEVHSFSSGRFIPDAFSGYTMAAEDTDAVTLQSIDGAMKLAIDDDQIRLRAGTSNILINKDGDITLARGAIGIALTAAGVAINGVLMINGHAYLAHHHSDPQGGTIGPVIE